MSKVELVQKQLLGIPDIGKAITEIDSGKSPSLVIGVVVLQKIYEQHGVQGVQDFATWATHPNNGIMVQITKPMPTHIAKTINDVSKDISAEVIALRNQPRVEAQMKHLEDTRMTRRGFDIALGAFVGGLLGGGATGAYSMLQKDEPYEKKIRRIAVGALAGAAGFGGLLAVVSVEGREVYMPIPPIEQRYPITAQSVHFMPEYIAVLTTDALQALVAPPVRKRT